MLKYDHFSLIVNDIVAIANSTARNEHRIIAIAHILVPLILLT